MEQALTLAEANGGKLRSAWGILPINLTVKRNDLPWSGATDEHSRTYMNRIDVSYDFSWSIDEAYWQHCRQRFADKFPVTMAKIEEEVNGRLTKAA